MGTSVKFKEKKVKLQNDKIDEILKILGNLLTSEGVNLDIAKGEAVPDEYEKEEKGITNKIRNYLETCFGIRMGGNTRGFKAFVVELDDPAYKIWEKYLFFMNEQLSPLKKGAEEAEADLINSRFILIYHILIRIVAISLCSDMQAHRDGDTLLRVLAKFCDSIVEKAELLSDGFFYSKYRDAEEFRNFLAVDMGRWISHLASIVKTIKVMHAPKKAITATADSLKELERRTIRLLCARLEPTLVSAKLADSFLNNTLNDCEDKALASNKNVLINKKNTQLIITIKQNLVIEECKDDQTRKKLLDLYTILNETRQLINLTGRLDSIIQVTAWTLLVTGGINIGVLIDRLKKHWIRCAPILLVEKNDPLSKKNVWEGLITHKAIGELRMPDACTEKECGGLGSLVDEGIIHYLLDFFLENVRVLNRLQHEFNCQGLLNLDFLNKINSLLSRKEITSNNNQSIQQARLEEIKFHGDVIFPMLQEDKKQLIAHIPSSSANSKDLAMKYSSSSSVFNAQSNQLTSTFFKPKSLFLDSSSKNNTSSSIGDFNMRTTTNPNSFSDTSFIRLLDEEEKGNKKLAQNNISNIQGLKYQSVPGDGHCLFHAVGLYVGQDQKTLRNVVAARIEFKPDEFEEVIKGFGKKVKDFADDVRNGIEWADNIEIVVLMKLLNRPIVIIGSDGKIRNQQDIESFKGEPIFVFYNDNDHYDALLLKNESNGKEILGHLRQSSVAVPFIKINKDSRGKMEIELPSLDYSKKRDNSMPQDSIDEVRKPLLERKSEENYDNNLTNEKDLKLIINIRRSQITTELHWRLYQALLVGMSHVEGKGYYFKSEARIKKLKDTDFPTLLKKVSYLTGGVISNMDKEALLPTDEREVVGLIHDMVQDDDQYRLMFDFYKELKDIISWANGDKGKLQRFADLENNFHQNVKAKVDEKVNEMLKINEEKLQKERQKMLQEFDKMKKQSEKDIQVERDKIEAEKKELMNHVKKQIHNEIKQQIQQQVQQKLEIERPKMQKDLQDEANKQIKLERDFMNNNMQQLQMMMFGLQKEVENLKAEKKRREENKHTDNKEESSNDYNQNRFFGK